jgi:chemotaxis protein MotB
LFGGDSLFAIEKNIYKVIAIKVDSNIKTTFHVYAENKDEAAEEVALNGWDIVEVTLIKKYEEYSETNANIKNLSNINTNKKQKNNISLYNEKKSEYILITYFDFGKDSTTLTEKEIDRLKQLNPKSIYFIYGHTDSVPVKANSKYKNNYDLSLKRANFIKEQMIKFAKIPPENIKVVGLGEFFPAVSNSLKGEKKNRRVEIYEKTK